MLQQYTNLDSFRCSTTGFTFKTKVFSFPMYGLHLRGGNINLQNNIKLSKNEPITIKTVFLLHTFFLQIPDVVHQLPGFINRNHCTVWPHNTISCPDVVKKLAISFI